MFEQLQKAPADPILGLTEAFNKETNPDKINLSVGVYQDDTGKTPVLQCVKEAEKRLLTSEKSKSYRPISGAADYGVAVGQLIFGNNHPILAANRALTAHTPGGTGGLRVAGDYLHQVHPKASIWLPDPTWANHPQIFALAGLNVKTYPWFDAQSNTLAFDQALAALSKIPTGDAVLLHGCCHNPTGADPTPAQWNQIADALANTGALPLMDFAYQGFGEGLEQDAVGVCALAGKVREMLICSSFSKNFGLYNERVGALTIVGSDATAADVVMSHVKVAIRANYSNPPAHGGSIVTTILSDAALRKQWEEELTTMRERINGMRQLFVDKLKAVGVPGDYSFILRQRGMFSFSGLTKQQVQTLRDRYAIYIVGSGRINVAGMTNANMGRLCDAIKAIV